MSKRGLLDIFRRARLPEHVNLLLVVDQFEELFRYRRLAASGQEEAFGVSEEATAFVNLLLEVRQQADFPVHVVLTMRSDFLGDCAQFQGLPEAINAGQFLVPRMTRDERRAAIAGPVGVGGAEMAPILLTRLVNDVGDNPDQLSILQHALNRTWAQWEDDGATGPLDLPHYEAIGTMAQALDRHAEEAYAELHTEPKQHLCQKLFKALTDKGTDARGIRRPTKLGTLCALVGASQAEVVAVIDVFRDPSRSFMMPPLGEPLTPETVIDISHESLMRVWQRLKRWADEEAESARTYGRLTETAALYAAQKASLWRDPDLQLALDWKAKAQPTAAWAAQYGGGYVQAMDFLAKSEALRAEEQRQEKARQRRLRFLLGIVAVFAVLAAAGAIWGWTSSIKATQAAAKAQLEAQKAEETVAFVMNMFEEANPESSLGDTLTVFDLVDKAALRIERELAGQPVVQAQMLNVIGDVYETLGDYGKATVPLRHALRIRSLHPDRQHEDVGQSLNSLGTVLADKDSLAAAEAALRMALAIRRNLLGEAHPDVAESLNNLALVLKAQGDSIAVAESLYRRALAIRRTFQERAPDDVAETLSNLGALYYYTRDYDKADSLHRAALEIREQFYGLDHPLLARSLINLSAALYSQAKVELYPRGDSLLQADSLLAYALWDQADSLLQQAGSLMERALEMRRQLLGDEHPEVAIIHFNLAGIRRGELKYDAAGVHFEAAGTVFRTRKSYSNLAWTLVDWGEMLTWIEQCDEAESILEEALALAGPPANLGEDHEDIAYAAELREQCSTH